MKTNKNISRLSINDLDNSIAEVTNTLDPSENIPCMNGVTLDYGTIESSSSAIRIYFKSQGEFERLINFLKSDTSDMDKHPYTTIFYIPIDMNLGRLIQLDYNASDPAANQYNEGFYAISFKLFRDQLDSSMIECYLTLERMPASYEGEKEFYFSSMGYVINDGSQVASMTFSRSSR